LLKQINNYDEAIKHLEASITKLTSDSDKAVIYNLLGGIFAERGLTDNALEALISAIDMHPNLGAAHENLARLYETMGRYPDAITEFSRAKEIEPRACKNFCVTAV